MFIYQTKIILRTSHNKNEISPTENTFTAELFFKMDLKVGCATYIYQEAYFKKIRFIF